MNGLSDLILCCKLRLYSVYSKALQRIRMRSCVYLSSEDLRSKFFSRSIEVRVALLYLRISIFAFARRRTFLKFRDATYFAAISLQANHSEVREYGANLSLPGYICICWRRSKTRWTIRDVVKYDYTASRVNRGVVGDFRVIRRLEFTRGILL